MQENHVALWSDKTLLNSEDLWIIGKEEDFRRHSLPCGCGTCFQLNMLNMLKLSEPLRHR